MARKVWGYWDCPVCGTKRIIAKEKDCPNCGAGAPGPHAFYFDGHARGADGRYIGVDVVDEPELLSKVGRGADWVCPSCATGNWQADAHCRMCGTSRAQRSGSSRGPSLQGGNGQEASKRPPAKVVRSREAPLPTPLPDETETKKGLEENVFVWVLGGLFLFLSVGVCVWGFQTHPTEGRVSAMTWRHTTTLQQWTPYQEGDWCSSVFERREIPPTNGRGERAGVLITGRDYRYRRTVQEACGTERVSVPRTRRVACGSHESCSSAGDGSFDCRDVTDYCTESYTEVETRTKYCDRRVNDWYCTYMTQRWVDVDRRTLAGTGREVQWHQFRPSTLQRESRAGEWRVDVTYSGANTTYLSPSSEAEYLTWSLGQQAQVDVSNLFGVLAVKHPLPAEAP